MTVQYKNPKTSDREIDGGILTGTTGATSGAYVVGKPVKLADHGFTITTSPDEEVWGFIDSVNSANEKGSDCLFVGVQIEGRVIALNSTGATAAVLAVGDNVVSGYLNQAYSVSQTYPIIKKAAALTAGVKYWRVVDLRGNTGATGATVTIQYC